MKYFDPRLERLMSEKGDNSDMSKQPRTSEILALWEDKQRRLIDDKHNDAIAKLQESDVLNQKLHSLAKDILDSIIDFTPDTKKEIVEHKDFYVEEIVQSLPKKLSRFSSVTNSEIHSATITYKEELNKLRAKFQEINVMLSACDTYEQEMNILRTYGVIDADGKLAELYV